MMNCENCLHFPYDCSYWQINVADVLPAHDFIGDNAPNDCPHYEPRQHRGGILTGVLNKTIKED